MDLLASATVSESTESIGVCWLLRLRSWLEQYALQSARVV